MAHIYLSIGTNLGDRSANIEQALLMLDPSILVEKVSPVYETEPMHIKDQALFYNITVAATTMFSPLETLAKLKEIERTMGRTDSLRYGPRIIDLDLLYYEDMILESPELIVPHPRISERAFVLAPLADIAPGMIDPVLKTTVAEMLAAIPERDKIITRLHQ